MYFSNGYKFCFLTFWRKFSSFGSTKVFFGPVAELELFEGTIFYPKGSGPDLH